MRGNLDSMDRRCWGLKPLIMRASSSNSESGGRRGFPGRSPARQGNFVSLRDTPSVWSPYFLDSSVLSSQSSRCSRYLCGELPRRSEEVSRTLSSQVTGTRLVITSESFSSSPGPSPLTVSPWGFGGVLSVWVEGETSLLKLVCSGLGGCFIRTGNRASVSLRTGAGDLLSDVWGSGRVAANRGTTGC